VAPSVQGLLFKDLKQILRKEQCDASILITANVPSAKKIVVHGPNESDSGAIPSQFPIQEDTQFSQILQESLDFFSIDEHRQREYFLVDYRTNQIHNPSAYVRDFMHKLSWVKLIRQMFEAMVGNFAYSGDIHLFINFIKRWSSTVKTP
jgi:hypothetical protein